MIDGAVSSQKQSRVKVGVYYSQWESHFVYGALIIFKVIISNF